MYSIASRQSAYCQPAAYVVNQYCVYKAILAANTDEGICCALLKNNFICYIHFCHTLQLF